MNDSEDRVLPVVGHVLDGDTSDGTPSCSPEVYVTNEEAALLAAMRGLKKRAAGIRERLSHRLSDEQRAALLAELEDLRARRIDLARRRDQAYRRKMVMLGHLPPDALVD
jgi:hypothetical protein